MELAFKGPWRAIEVKRGRCSVEDCQGYALGKRKLRTNGEVVIELGTWSKYRPSTGRFALSSTSAAPAADGFASRPLNQLTSFH